MKNCISIGNGIFFVVVSVCLMGCVSTQKVNQRLSDNWIGKNFDEFVIKHGNPSQKFMLNSGDIAYTWNSGTTTVPMPATATTTTTGNVSNTQMVGGGSFRLFCEVQIITDARGVIKHVKIMKDTTGFWTTSCCHEVLE